MESKKIYSRHNFLCTIVGTHRCISALHVVIIPWEIKKVHPLVGSVSLADSESRACRGVIGHNAAMKREKFNSVR